jgi:hypothetical protein
MSKIDNLALTLYNKDRNQLMKLYNNKRTSQLRKNIIKEIFNQEGGRPFIFFDEENDKYVKDINENKENEIIYVTYFISVTEEEIIYNSISEWLSENIPKINYGNIELEDKYFQLCSNYYHEIHNYQGDSIICTFGIYKEKIIGYKFFTYKNLDEMDKMDEMDENILVIMENENLPYKQYLSLKEYINIDNKFRNLSICKILFEENIKLSTRIFNLNMFYCEVAADDLNAALSCYDNGYFKSGYKYRISYFDRETNYNTIFKKYNSLREEGVFINKEIDREILYFKDLTNLYLDNYLLISISLTKELYDKYDLDINKFVWYELLYIYIFKNDDWINDKYCKLLMYNIHINKFNSLNFKGQLLDRISKNEEIRALIIPTDIYIKQINTIYVLIDRVIFNDEILYKYPDEKLYKYPDEEIIES